jgi:hypothetical protein
VEVTAPNLGPAIGRVVTKSEQLQEIHTWGVVAKAQAFQSRLGGIPALGKGLFLFGIRNKI